MHRTGLQPRVPIDVVRAPDAVQRGRQPSVVARPLLYVPVDDANIVLADMH